MRATKRWSPSPIALHLWRGASGLGSSKGNLPRVSYILPATQPASTAAPSQGLTESKHKPSGSPWPTNSMTCHTRGYCCAGTFLTAVTTARANSRPAQALFSDPCLRRAKKDLNKGHARACKTPPPDTKNPLHVPGGVGRAWPSQVASDSI